MVQVEHLSKHTVVNSHGVSVPTSHYNVWGWGLEGAPMGWYALLNGHTAVGDGTRETAYRIAAEVGDVGDVADDKEARRVCQKYAAQGMFVSDWAR